MSHQSLTIKCPCCGFSSLPSNVAATCSICWWEADGLDLPDDVVRAAPNKGYSLDHARRNFLAHGHMYDKANAGSYLCQEGEGRKALMEYVRDVLSDKVIADQTFLECLIRAERHSWPWRNQPVDETEEERLLEALLN